MTETEITQSLVKAELLERSTRQVDSYVITKYATPFFFASMILLEPTPVGKFSRNLPIENSSVVELILLLAQRGPLVQL